MATAQMEHALRVEGPRDGAVIFCDIVGKLAILRNECDSAIVLADTVLIARSSATASTGCSSDPTR